MPDEEIFDFTDSRFLNPPVENQRNFPEVAVVTVRGESFVTPAPLLLSPSSPAPVKTVTHRPRKQRPTPQPIFQLPEQFPVKHVPHRKNHVSQLARVQPSPYLSSVSTIKPFVNLGSGSVEVPSSSAFSTPVPTLSSKPNLGYPNRHHKHHKVHQQHNHVIKQLPSRVHSEVRTLKPRYNHHKYKSKVRLLILLHSNNLDNLTLLPNSFQTLPKQQFVYSN